MPNYLLWRNRPDGRLVIGFDWLHTTPPFHEEGVRRELLARINGIPNVHFDEDVLTKRARIPFAQLTSPDAIAKLKETLAWLIDIIKAKQASEFQGA